MLEKLIVILGHVYCGVVGVLVTYCTRFMEYVARKLIGFVEIITGATIVMPEVRFFKSPFFVLLKYN